MVRGAEGGREEQERAPSLSRGPAPGPKGHTRPQGSLLIPPSSSTILPVPLRKLQPRPYRVRRAARAACMREVRREQIIDAAKAVFAAKGYHDASIDDVIARAEIARGTFYLYFDGKSDVFETVLEEALNDLRSLVRPIDVSRGAPPPERQLREIVRGILEHALRDRDFTRLLLSLWMNPDADAAPSVLAFHALVTDLIAASLEKGVQKGLVRRCDPALAAPAALGAARGLLAHLLLADPAPSLDAAADALIAFAMRGIGVPARWT